MKHDINNYNIENKLKYKFAIIGAGNGGRAFASYLANLGHIVNLVYRSPSNIREIFLRHKIVTEGAINGIFHVNMVTDDFEEAIKDVDYILYVLPASAHLEITRKIIPYLKNNQKILINPGRTWGALETYFEIKKNRPNINIQVGETQTLLFTSRKLKDFGVSILKIKDSVDYCFYPEEDNILNEATLEYIFPQLKSVDNICITSLTNIGSVIHPCVTILNSGTICREDELLFYKDGVNQYIAQAIEEVDNERCKIMEAMGQRPIKFPEWAKKAYNIDEKDYLKIFHKIKSYRDINAPQDIRMRYLTEDVPFGLVPISSLGKYLEIPTPMIDSLITIAGIMLNIDFYDTGRTLKRIGFNPEEILQRLKPEISAFEGFWSNTI